MTITDKYWIQVNKKSFKYDIVAIIILSGLLGIASSFGICYYMLRIISYSMRFLNLNGLYSTNMDGLNQVLIMPFSREQIYKTYVKMMLIMSCTFAFIVGLSKFVYALILGPSIIISDSAKVKPTFLINISYYLIVSCGLLILLIVLSKRINNYSIKSKLTKTIFLLPTIIFYFIFMNFIFMTIILQYPLAEIFYFIFALVGFIVLIKVLIKSIKKNHHEFVVKFRRYAHVQ